MTQNEIKQKIKEYQDIIEKSIEKCSPYKNSKDGSYGMCLYSNGYGQAKSEIKELEGKLNESA